MSHFELTEENLRHADCFACFGSPYTTSTSSESASRRCGTSSGGFCRSSSSVTMTGFFACRTPAKSAACWPELRPRRNPRTRLLFRASCSTTCHVESVLPSSTITTSDASVNHGDVVTRSTSRERVCGDRYVGTNTDTSIATSSSVRINADAIVGS